MKKLITWLEKAAEVKLALDVSDELPILSFLCMADILQPFVLKRCISGPLIFESFFAGKRFHFRSKGKNSGA